MGSNLNNLGYVDNLDITPKTEYLKEISQTSAKSLKLKTSALQKIASREWEDDLQTFAKDIPG